jgi:hypothetical protein
VSVPSDLQAARDPAERLHVVASHFRGLVLAVLFVCAPWYGVNGHTGAYLLDQGGERVFATTKDAFAVHASARTVMVVVRARWSLITFSSMALGTLALVVLPRRRLPRGALAGALLAVTGATSLFLDLVLFTACVRLGLFESGGVGWTIASDLVACVPLAFALLVLWWLSRWSDRAWWGGWILASFALVSPVLGEPSISWGARAFAVLAAITWWREARRWDELPRPEGPWATQTSARARSGP